MLLLSLSKQKAISRSIGILDDKIDLNRRMNETLEAMARAIFKSWFVDFDRVRAKMEGRQPVGMDAETVRLFPDSLGECTLGPVPKGWTIRRLLNLTSKIGSGATPRGGSGVYLDKGTALNSKVCVHTLVDNCPRMTPFDGQTLMLGNAVKTRAGKAPARFSVPNLLDLDSPCRRPKTHGAT